MIWAFTGLLLGIILALLSDFTIPVELTKYTAVSIIGVLDSLLGAIKSEVENEKYDSTLFVTGLSFNILLALGLTLLGEVLGLDLYLAATVVFTFRIFTNLAIIRRAALKEIRKLRKKRR